MQEVKGSSVSLCKGIEVTEEGIEVKEEVFIKSFIKGWKLKRKSSIFSLAVLNYHRKRKLERQQLKMLFSFLEALNIQNGVQVILVWQNQ